MSMVFHSARLQQNTCPACQRVNSNDQAEEVEWYVPAMKHMTLVILLELASTVGFSIKDLLKIWILKCLRI